MKFLGDTDLNRENKSINTYSLVVYNTSTNPVDFNSFGSNRLLNGKGLGYKLRIKKVILSGSWYNITSNRRSVVTSLGTASVTAGDYTLSELLSAIQTQLVAIDATFTVSQNSVTGLVTIARTGNFTLTHNNLLWMLGFRSTQTLNGAATYTGEAVPDVLVSAIYFRSDNLSDCISGRKIIIDDSNQYVKLPSSYLFSVPVGTGYTYYEPDNLPDITITRDFIGFKLELYDNFGEIVNLNGGRAVVEVDVMGLE